MVYNTDLPQYVNALKNAQRESGMTHGQIATKMGISRVHVTMVVNGKSKPTMDFLMLFGDAIGAKVVLRFKNKHK